MQNSIFLVCIKRIIAHMIERISRIWIMTVGVYLIRKRVKYTYLKCTTNLRSYINRTPFTCRSWTHVPYIIWLYLFNYLYSMPSLLTITPFSNMDLGVLVVKMDMLYNRSVMGSIPLLYRSLFIILSNRSLTVKHFLCS